ncbi:MAG: tRNA pseudouridine(55) synthase TruB [Actinobacteria bacterium]|nr:tRNA pseudouridine(55) synthase TruB [Actinomycetota bacterium]
MTRIDGFVVIDKPAGITSHDVVSRLRKVLGTRQIGHAGTLDPMATGVLVLGINNGTKFLQYIVSGKKRYQATIRLGESRTTDDKNGETISTKSVAGIKPEQIKNELSRFHGEIDQIPSSVSAIKVNGKRAYQRVREGEVVELKARKVQIFNIEVLEIRTGEFLDLDIDVTCSAGTYIRAIARDLGDRLGVGGHLTALRRSEVQPFTLNDVTDVDKPVVRPLADSLHGLMSQRNVSSDEKRDLSFGRTISPSEFQGPGVALFDGDVIAIIENKEERAQPLAVFMKESS